MAKLLDGERHAGVRLEQRYGLTLTEELKVYIVREIERAIKHQKKRGRKERPIRERGREPRAFLLARTTGDPRNSKWQVDYEGHRLCLVYDMNAKLIVTFLPQRSTK